MGEIKQTNFRIDQETADAFRRFCEENGMNQAQGFDHVMQVVELDKAKAAIPDRATEIEGFEKSVKDIMAAYLRLIEINNSAEARIREQFASSIDRNERAIDELREKAEQLQAEKEAAETARAEAEEREKNAADQMNAAKKIAADKEQINAMLTAQLAEAAQKLDGYDALKASEAELRGRLADMEKALADQKKDAENTAKTVQAQAELAQERAVMAKERELNEKIRQADKENARLSARIEQLQAQIDGENGR